MERESTPASVLRRRAYRSRERGFGQRRFLRANNSLSFDSLPTLDLREKFATARFFQWASIVRGGLAKAEARGRTKMVNQERAQERLRNNKRSQVMRIVIDFKDAYSQLASFFNGC
jgi:hypothetical protein